MSNGQAFARSWFAAFVAAFEEQKEYLGDLDRRSGDGDFAINIASALRRAGSRVAELSDDADDADVFRAISLGFIDTGGSSGPLLGMWFRGLSKACEGHEWTTAVLADGIRSGTDAIQRLGGARVGDKTMVDAMVPAADSLEASREQGREWQDALREAAESARAGADSTESLLASLGRASYVGEAAAGVVDPGASAVALFFESGARASVPEEGR